MLQKVIDQILFLREKLENQISENKPYNEVCDTSEKLDMLILEYYDLKKMYNQNDGCTSG